jgi:hypothetical protein
VGLPVHRFCCKAIADDSAADNVMQIINLLWIGTAASYIASWV